MCIMFAEKLNDVRADLVTNVKVDELLLSCMTETSAVSSGLKNNIESVCTQPLLVYLCHYYELVLDIFFVFYSSLQEQKIVAKYY